MRSFQLIIFSAIFSFFAIYTIVWAVFEPFPIKENYQWIRWYIIIGISLILTIFGLLKRGLLSYVFYRYIRPLLINKLQLLSTRLSDDSLSEGWRFFVEETEARPRIVEDNLFGKTCRFEDEYTHDAFHGIKVIAKEKGKKIDYFIKPIAESSKKNPIIYIRVEVRNISNPVTEKNEYKWLSLVIDKIHKSESKELSEAEEVIYVESKATFMGWMYFAVDIEEIIKKITRWERVFAFNKIEGIKVRGAFDLGSIMIYA
jgi:desulfoferrodoxin (superoxide reductase-like protein)